MTETKQLTTVGVGIDPNLGGTAVVSVGQTLQGVTGPFIPVVSEFDTALAKWVDAGKADIETDFARAHAVLERFGLAFVALIVGWLIGKLF